MNLWVDLAAVILGYGLGEVMFPEVQSCFRHIKNKVILAVYAKQSQQQWPLSLLILSSALKAGLTLEESLQVMIEESPHPHRMLLKSRAQVFLAWTPLSERVARIFSEPEFYVLRKSLLLAAQTGGSYVPLLEAQAKTWRKKQVMRQKASAYSAQSRLTAAIVGFLPFLFLVVLWKGAPEFIDPLLNTEIGRVFLLVAALLNAMGFWVMKRMLSGYE